MKSYLGRFCVLAPMLLAVAGCNSGEDGDIRYVAIGASDATGIGATPLNNGYVYRIDNTLDAECNDGAALTNLGIPGAEADEIEDIQVPVAIAIEPDLVTVFVGGNDLVNGRMVDSFEGNLTDILTQLRNETPAAIFVANLPDLTQLTDVAGDADVTAERVAAYNAAIQRQTAAVGATLVDLFSEPIDPSFVADDGFHPSDTGHEQIANLFLQEITPQLCNAPSESSAE